MIVDTGLHFRIANGAKLFGNSEKCQCILANIVQCILETIFLVPHLKINCDTKYVAKTTDQTC